MLSTITLTNYRCFSEHEVEFCRSSLLVGANNAGKSTLVEAIRLLAAVTRQRLGFNAPPDWTGLPARCHGVSPATKDLEMRGGSFFHKYGDPPAKIVARFSNGSSITLLVGPNNQTFALVANAEGKEARNREQAQKCGIPRIDILPQIGPLAPVEPVLNQDYVTRSMNSQLASRHFRNQLYFTPTLIEAFNKRAEATWRGLKILTLDRETDGDRDVLSLMLRDGSFAAEASWMGHGLQMWMQTIWFLTRAEDSACIVLDEPDVYMHADLQRRLIRVLRMRQRQTIVATHSIEMIAEVSPEEIIIVDKARSRSRAAPNLPAVQSVIDRIGGVHNIHITRLWSSRKCLHVEGEDLGMLKPCQDALYPLTEAPIDTIASLSIGGWGGWAYAIGSSMQLKNAAGQDIQSFCLFDCDYHTPAEVMQRYAEADQRGIQLHVWSRKELENYLLCATTIQRIIADAADGRNVPSIEEILAEMDRGAEIQKDPVFDVLVSEYLAVYKGKTAMAIKLARRRMDEAWATFDGRIGIVCGKELLGLMSSWASKRFSVSFGAVRISRELRIAEIPDEVQAVIKAIETCTAFPANLRNIANDRHQKDLLLL